MGNKTYAEKLKDPRWQKKRLDVLNRDGFKCTLCSDEKTTLHVHHEKYNGEPWEANDEDLKTVCEHCHGLLEYIKKNDKWMLEYVTGVFKRCWDTDNTYYVSLAADILIYKSSPGEGIRECNTIDILDYNIIRGLMAKQENHGN